MRVRIPLFLAATLTVMSCTPAVVAVIPPPVVPAQPASPAPPQNTTPANILVLGDSQISFGAGGAYRSFFSSLGEACPSLPARYGRAEAAAIGVRSTALHHWTASSGSPRGVICDVDEKFGVNAGAYGVTSPNRTYVQIGQNPDYPFCTPAQSPLKAVFDAPAYDPDLVVLAFLGNATERWQSTTAARADWQAAEQQLPADVACLVMTTIPGYDAADNRARTAAQRNLDAAVTASGRCAFVAGLTPATLAAFENNPAYFRTNAAGTVVDPRHPTAASGRAFTDLQSPAICAALTRILPD